jgi:hypothetical protein
MNFANIAKVKHEIFIGHLMVDKESQWLYNKHLLKLFSKKEQKLVNLVVDKV